MEEKIAQGDFEDDSSDFNIDSLRIIDLSIGYSLVMAAPAKNLSKTFGASTSFLNFYLGFSKNFTKAFLQEFTAGYNYFSGLEGDTVFQLYFAFIYGIANI
ncbi:MAG: hypothetical protein A2504_14135 [Bdellovibrionales bacterium RIFOXYD12_FULL_39_22]|nr:MAG: hypothetical protein A2385_04570 [Bdellovibrionales bacterium RIFOXYB1_FULL_39_21]OFZ43422.1 MAG: hypothetical protein A2485_13085 [Bdellovibrionales bacterium RIFOXYC12_FULL_39_17]OFZ46965.1 MAG: hypothetical protein A2404_00145 [Bdellovibrionales bacterium RIFOXYC1_FULL_39_130]OFZ71490.1 MAG: hypothetical protein A2451_00115 [Bdellovibrionales bacterium RIFOXYC2_FULL_39_8]OFZ76162.1 MAG: hypothetical protein A2560_07395 [Bdellovibrionales bacterium RIFOXYD1_FULL_39_84]OFZ94397.1 MAG: